MRKRTQARELALQILYQIDVINQDAQEALDGYSSDGPEAEKDVKDFSRQLILGTVKHKGLLDKEIEKFADNWELKRMAVVDRNVLRLACFELIYLEDIPSKVTINEAVDLAKRYGGLDSGKFINGILDKINKTVLKKS